MCYCIDPHHCLAVIGPRRPLLGFQLAIAFGTSSSSSLSYKSFVAYFYICLKIHVHVMRQYFTHKPVHIISETRSSLQDKSKVFTLVWRTVRWLMWPLCIPGSACPATCPPPPPDHLTKLLPLICLNRERHQFCGKFGNTAGLDNNPSTD